MSPMAQRSTFLVHVTTDGRVRVETVATGEVVGVANLDLVGAAIKQSLSDGESDGGSDGESGEDAGVQG